MNKTFKVVFNRARGALMVANEVTSSVQKKGTKTVLAVAALSLISTSSFAEAINSWTGEPPTIENNTIEFKGSDKTSPVYFLNVGEAATGKIEDLSLTMKAKGPKDGTSQDQPLVVVYNASSTNAVEFGGKSLNLTIETDFVGDGNNQAAAMNLQKATNITADKVSLSVTSTHSKGKSIYGIAAGTGTPSITLSSSDVNINLETATEWISKNFSEAIGIDIYKTATFDATKVSTLTITGESKGTKTTTTGTDGGSPIFGIVFEGGTGYFGGKTTVNLTAQGGNATGVKATNYFYNNTLGQNWGNAAGTLNNLEATVHSKTATASGIGVSYTAGTDTNNVILDVKGDSKLVATTNTGKAYGVNLSGATTAKLEGNVDIDATATGEKSEAYGAYADNGGTVTLGSTGKSVSLETSAVAKARAGVASNSSTLNIVGKEIKIKSSERGLQASVSSSLNVGNSETESIYVNAGTIGVVGFTGSKINLEAKEITLESDSIYATMQLQNNTEKVLTEEEAKRVTTLTVKADQFNVKNAKGPALCVFSNAQLHVNANTEINAKNVIDVRGNSTANINVDGKHTTKLDGNIVFETPNSPGDSQNSGKIINANVNLVLNGTDSYWNGRSYQAYKVNGKSQQLVGLEGDASYHGNVTGFNLTVADGAKWTLSGDSFVNTLALKEGGKIDASKAEILNVGKWDASANAAVSGFTVSGKGNELTLGTKTALNGAITMAADSELITPLATAFTTTTEKDSSVVSGATARLSITSDKTAKLTIDDAFTYTNAGLTAMTNAYSSVTLNLTKATLAVSETEKATLVEGVIQGSTTVEVTVTKDTESVSLGTSTANVTTGAQTIVLDKSADVTVNNLTVVGKTDGSAFIENAKTVKVAENATLNLGSAEAEAATSGTLPEVTLEKTATLNVTNTAVMTSSLTGGTDVKINLGTTEAAGVLHTEKLALNGAMIFLDPAWQDDSTIGDASSFSAVTVDNLNGTIVAGQNSVVALGATKDAAVAGFNKISQGNGLTWGSEGITAGLYIGTPLTLTEASKILVNGSLTEAPESSAVSSGLTIESNGILMLDQSGIGSNKAVSGVEKVTIAGDATVAVVNAKGDTTLQLADAVSISSYTEGEEPATKTVLTDNPFVKGTLTASSGTIALSDYADETGINVIASMGVQSMIRHADAVLAETIADRAAEVTTGNGLWVSVRGERFEQKKLGGGAGFKANMGYGAFGAEFTPTDATSLGVAFQYGFGTVKGKLYSAKNKTKDYGLTLYGSTLLGDTGVKLLGEVSYTKSTNDLTNNYFTGLNQDLDAKMISGGITAQKHFAAGSFDLVPSVGVRVSRITTDAMKAGESRIAKEKQTLVQVPIALRVNAKAIETEGGWAITPRFKVAFVPTFGDKEIKIFGAEKTVLDTTPVQGAFGVSFVKGNFTIDATANLGVSNKDTSTIGGKVGLSYRF